jgi:hypothetical protein
MKLTDADIAAFKLAIEMKRARGASEWAQVQEMLSERGFERAGMFACYSCQCENLKTKPWQPVPSMDMVRLDIDEILEDGDDGIMGSYAAAVLARRMRALGLSLFHPDPLAAIERARKEPAA